MKSLRVFCWVIGSLALLLMIGGTHSAWAQDVTATITGTVTDSSGGAVAGATVTAKSVERLMGTKAEARFEFIQERAEFASEEMLDV